jgi:hypothetical protein
MLPVPRGRPSSEPLPTADEHARPTVPAPPSVTESAVRVKIAHPHDSQDAEAAGASAAPTREPSAVGHRAVIHEQEARLLAAIRDRDRATALLFASTLAYIDPEHEVARRIKRRCLECEETVVARELPHPDAIVRMVISWGEVEGRGLSRRALYLLSLVDRGSTVQAIVEASAMRPLVAYDALDRLLQQGIIAVDERTHP